MSERITAFRLRCVGCLMVEDRAASGCTLTPSCSRCYAPMMVEEVILSSGRSVKAEKRGVAV